MPKQLTYMYIYYIDPVVLVKYYRIIVCYYLYDICFSCYM